MVQLTTVSYAIEGPAATVTVRRPDAGNRVNQTLAAELSDVCHDLELQRHVVVVILTASGDEYFCAGTDQAEAFEDFRDRRQSLPSVASSIAALNMPVVCALNGDAIGQGLELALACDIRLAAEHVQVALPCSAGFLPWDGGTQRLPRLIGVPQAIEMILTGQMVNAQEALRMGLLSRLVPRNELMTSANELAHTIATKAPWAARFAKEAVRAGLDVTLDQGLRLEANLYFLLQTTQDRTEGIRAFQRKRPPRFVGD